MAINFQVQSWLLTFRCNFEERREGLRGQRDTDRITDDAVESQASGSPMSQQTNSGFNASLFAAPKSKLGLSPERFGKCRTSKLSETVARFLLGSVAARAPVSEVPFGGWPPEDAFGVRQRFVDGDPIEALSDVRGIDGRSRKINSPDGVAVAPQVMGDSVEPSEASLLTNLLSHDDSWAARTDESMKVGP